MIDTTRLIRSSPFGEWVNVFYDPAKTNIDTLQGLMRNGGCSNASHIADSNGNVLNPIIAPGDPIQLKVKTIGAFELAAGTSLPNGWQLVDRKKDTEGTDIVTVSTSKGTPQADTDFVLEFNSGEKIKAKVAVVGQVGSH